MHRGKIIEDFLRKNEINLTELSTRLPFTLRTIYRHFEKEDLELEKILSYSEVLKHDFSDEIPEMEALKFRLREPAEPYSIKAKRDVSEAEYYKDRYFSTLEKLNETLEKYNSLLQKRQA